MKRIRTAYLIHGFAVLHAAVTLACLLIGVPDSLILTLLTMLLTVLICLRRNLSVEFTAICVILVNIVGYVIGSLIAQVFNFPSEMLSRCLATFFTTELLGWALNLFARTYRIPAGRRGSWKDNLGWLIFAVVTVFALRLVIEYVIFREGPFQGVSILGVFRSLMGNSLVVLGMFAGTLYFIRKGHKWHYSLDVATIGTTLFIGLMAVLGALIHTLGLPFQWNPPLDVTAFARNLVVALIVETAVFALIYVIEYAVKTRTELVTQRERRHQAEFRYMALKNQVNPHFLFNSLNILDSIIQEEPRETASRYVHKLSGIYRYMLQHDGSRLVRLSEEETFVTMYYDLLKVRFPEGFTVEKNIREEDLGRMIVPCTLQLLLENVTKHNAISADSPIHISVQTADGFLEMENNRVPKASPATSTGLGLKYIRQQYLDISGREIEVDETDESFRVRIPLL
ncbi:MAG: histidine kinase [Bacteroidales bacterium]|nr:histidine kinase [Bacteroidales bacterium]